MRGRSIRFRLTVWYAAVLACALALFGMALWWAMRARLIEEIDREVEGRAARFEQYFRAESAEDAGSELRDELEEFCQALPPGSWIAISGMNGFSFEYPQKRPGTELRETRREFRIGETAFVLEAGAAAGEVRHTLALLGWLLIALIPAVIVVACAGGVWLSRRALAPVAEATRAVHAISIENLSARLPVPEAADEIARLAEVLNAMLTRLESAVATLSQFAADASHELRTPLAVIRTTAELALRRPRPAEAYRESLEEIAAETERMTQLIEDLLLLARTDTGTIEMPLSPLDVRAVVRDVCAELRGLAGLRRIHVRTAFCEDGATIAGNRAGLHRLFLVLMDNALKYSLEGGDVIVSVGRAGDRISVTVEDFGTGISREDLPNIFRRFYRSDAARAGEGHGLGLALAESIAKAHHAEIEVQSEAGEGARFVVHFAFREIGDVQALSESPA